ncbi:MAG: hypothetical protein EA415_03160 [Sphaerobacteraceae bacterium]|nr:MAG: hypothetical protein EA415_03160 [Sphaerobacteraceae bacterium]
MITLLLAVTSSPALAHGDVGLVNERVTLEPGETREFSGELHYHRLVGRVSADQPVAVNLVDGRAGEVVASYGPDTSFSFNELIRCCDDAVWAPHVLVLENDGSANATIDIVARLVHDDLAVMVYGAESFTRESVAVFGILWAGVVWRVTRGRKPPIRLGRAFGVTFGLVSVVGGLSILGFLRYGVGGPQALLAGISDVSVIPFNPIVSGVSAAILGIMILWGLAGVWWIRAQPLSSRAQWSASGLVLITLVIVTGVLVARTYGGYGIPVATALVAITPVLVVLVNGIIRGSGEVSRPDILGEILEVDQASPRSAS